MTYSMSTLKMSLLSVTLILLTFFLVSSVRFHQDPGQEFVSAYSSPIDTRLYLDCWHLDNAVTVEAVPVLPNLKYTLMFIDSTLYTMFYKDNVNTDHAIVLPNGMGVFSSTFDVPATSKTKNLYIAILFNGSNTGTSSIAEGTGICNDATSATDTQNFERQCRAFVNKHEEVNEINLTDNICKPMEIK